MYSNLLLFINVGKIKYRLNTYLVVNELMVVTVLWIDDGIVEWYSERNWILKYIYDVDDAIITLSHLHDIFYRI